MTTSHRSAMKCELTRLERMQIRLDNLLDRASKIKVETSKKESKEKTRRKIVLGHLALCWALEDPAFSQRILDGFYSQPLSLRDREPIIAIVTILGGDRQKLKFDRPVMAEAANSDAEEAAA